MLATRNHRIIVAALSVALATAGFVASGSAAFPGTNELLSVRNNGGQGKNISGRFAGPAINEDGQVVAFDSIAGNLVVGDTNKEADVFVRDRATDTIERASVAGDGAQANGRAPVRPSTGPANTSSSTPSPTTWSPATPTRPSTCSSGTGRAARRAVSVSSDEVAGQRPEPLPVDQRDGRYVAFVSLADNLVPDDTNGVEDVFVRNLVRAHRRVNLTSTGGRRTRRPRSRRSAPTGGGSPSAPSPATSSPTTPTTASTSSSATR